MASNYIDLPVEGGGGGGTVTSVTASSPLASSGGATPNITIQVASGSQAGALSAADWTAFNNATTLVTTSQSGNKFLASPSNGSSGAPTFRAIVAADIPTLNQNTTGTASNITASSNSTLTTLSALSLPTSQLSGAISLTTQVSGILPAANGGSPPVTRYFYVDAGRTDTYTADGSFARPFTTITAAVSQVITNADNATHPYVISVFPGSYSSLSLNSSALYNLTFQATGATPTGAGAAVTISGLTSTSNNTQLGSLVFSGFQIGNGVTLTGDINNTNFGSTQILFVGCDFEIGGGNVTFTNVNNISVYGGQFNGAGTLTVNNIAFMYMQGAEGLHSGSTLTLVQNNAGNQPSQSTGNYFLMSGTKFYSNTSIDAGSELDMIQTYQGSTGVVTNNGIVHSFNSIWEGTYTGNSGSALRVDGDTFRVAPTINGGATITNRGNFQIASVQTGASAQAATNAVLVMKDGHAKSTQTTAPTTTTNANAGTSASSGVSHATDTAGSISLTTGSAAWASGVQTTINFNKAYNVAPIVVLTPTGANAANSAVTRGVYVASATGNFTVNFATADTAGTTYTWNYMIMETQ